MDVRALKILAGCALSAALLSACGGGGGSDSGSASGPGTTPTTVPPVASTGTFTLGAAYRARAVSGANDSFTLSGSCIGTATIATAAAVPTTFEGVTGFSSAQDSTVSFTNCSPATGRQTGSTYFDANYLNIGLAVSGGEYAKYEALPVAIPASVKVGDTGTIVTLLTYADSTKTTVTGKRVLSYVIEADTASTAIANITTKSFDTTAQLQSTQQSRYRMSSTANTLTLVSIDVLFSAPSNVHLVYTPR